MTHQASARLRLLDSASRYGSIGWMHPYLDLLFFLACALLVMTGVFKILRPQPTAKVLGAIAITRTSVWLSRLLGSVEVIAGVVGLASPRGAGGTMVAALYLAFAIFLVFLVAFRPTLSSCGCTGRRDTPPSLLHAGLDLTAAGIAFVAATSHGPTLGGFVGSFGLYGMLSLVVAVMLGYGLYATIAYLPPALRAPVRLPVPQRQGGRARASLVDEIFRDARISPDDPSLWGGIRSEAAVP
jgi:methylamine utilization protein MauE